MADMSRWCRVRMGAKSQKQRKEERMMSFENWNRFHGLSCDNEKLDHEVELEEEPKEVALCLTPRIVRYMQASDVNL